MKLKKVNKKKIAGDNKRHQEATRWSLHLNKFLESTLSRVDLQIEPFYFVMRLIMNCIKALAACLAVIPLFSLALFSISAQNLPGNVSLSIYKSTRKMADSKD